MRYSGIDWRLLFGAAVALCVAVALSLRHLFFRKPDDPEEDERRRRSHLNQVGRIVEGYVVEIVEALGTPAAGSSPGFLSRRKTTTSNAQDDGARRLVRYSYSISGITYETAQDVTGLEERLCLERLAAGQQASVKYDPSNPSNSILVADDWSGIK